MPVISAPESVVGIAATRAPLTAATAFAVSIDAAAAEGDECARSTRLEQRRGRLRHLAGADRVDRRGRRLQLRRAGSAGGVVSSSKSAKPCSGSSFGACATPPWRKTTTRPASLQTKFPFTRSAAARGLTTGRRFGSTSARRCS